MSTTALFRQACKRLSLFVLTGSMAAAAALAQTVVVGPADQYAFQWDNGSGPTPLGLFFNASASQYEFRDIAGDAEFSINPQAGSSRFRTRLGVGMTTPPLNILHVNGSARFGNGTDYAVFDDDFDLVFSGSADYLVGNNRYAFRARSNEQYGLFFNASSLRYEFRDGSAAPTFHVGADSGEGWFKGGVTIGNSSATAPGTLRYNAGNFEGYNGSSWVGLNGGGIGDSDWTPGSNSFGATYSNTGARFAIGESDPQGHRFKAKMLLSDHAAVVGVEESTGGVFGDVLYSEGRLGWWNDNNLLGLPVDVDNIGVFGRKTVSGNPGAGVYGWTSDDATDNYGGIFAATGSGTNNYAVYAESSGGTNNYAGYFNGQVRTGYLNAVGDASVAASLDVGLDITTPRIIGDGGILNLTGTVAVSNQLSTVGDAAIGGSVLADGFISSDDYIEAEASLYLNSAVNSGRTSIIHTGFDDTWIWNEDGGDIVLWTTTTSGAIEDQMRLQAGGQVMIGPGSPAAGFKLSVSGKIMAEELHIQQTADWPDYVFTPEHRRPALPELEAQIQTLGHLPGMPSAATVAEEGFASGEMFRLLLEKVEELTLYTIEQQAEIDALRAALTPANPE